MYEFLENRDQREDGPFRTLTSRYKHFAIDNPIFEDSILFDVLVRALVDPDAIERSLAQSHYYISRENEAPWRTVWYGPLRSDQEFEKALSLLEDQIRCFEITDPGQVLHVIGLRLWLADVGLIDSSREEVAEQGKMYIDDLFAAEKLVPSPIKDWEERWHGGYEGLQFREAETSEFQLPDYP